MYVVFSQINQLVLFMQLEKRNIFPQQSKFKIKELVKQAEGDKT